jgi:adenine deaminase
MFVMKLLMNSIEKRVMLSEVALGNIPPDAVITKGVLFNVFTGEFLRRQSIWIKEGMIAYVGPDHNPPKGKNTEVIDADSMVLLPGLIDSHTHAVSARYGPEEFIKHLIPTGVTTVVTETIELASVAGKDGFEYLIKGMEGQPIRLYYTLAPLCGLTPTEEARALAKEEILSFLKDPKCLGIGEIYWSNLFLKGSQGERLWEYISMALEMGKVIEGHTAGASGRKLQAYTDFSISSCHEPITEEEVLERLRIGYWVMIREGSIRSELEGVKGIFKKKIDFRRLILATDSVYPDDLLEKGYLDSGLKKMMKLGVPAHRAFQMVTINVAEHFGIDHLIGALSPGRMADLLIIPSKKEFSPRLIMCNGKIIYREGHSLVEPKKIFFPDTMFDTVKIHDFIFPAIPKKGKVRVMELVTRLVTKERIVDLEDPEETKDIIMVLALDRLGSGKAFMGLLKGFGLQRGAFATTMVWDMGDMIIVGCDLHSMETAIERLKEIRGGCVYAIGGQVISEFAAPLCGILSLKPMEVLREGIKKMNDVLKENGVKLENPTLTIDVFGTPAIPHLRITHNGYVRLKDREILSLEV